MLKKTLIAFSTLAFVLSTTVSYADDLKDHKAKYACKNFHKSKCKKAKKK